MYLNDPELRTRIRRFGMQASDSVAEVAFAVQLATHNPPLSMLDVGGGGDCLFRCVAYVISGHAEDYQQWRDACADWLLAHPNDAITLSLLEDLAANHLFDSPVGPHRQRITTLAAYATHIRGKGYGSLEVELQICANLAGRDFTIFHSDSDHGGNGEPVLCQPRPAVDPPMHYFASIGGGGGHFTVLLPAGSDVLPGHIIGMQSFHGAEFELTRDECLAELNRVRLFENERFQRENPVFTRDELLSIGAGVWPLTKLDRPLYVTPMVYGELKVSPGRGSLSQEAMIAGQMRSKGLIMVNGIRPGIMIKTSQSATGRAEMPLTRLFKRFFMSAAEEGRMLAIRRDQPDVWKSLSISHLDSGKSTLGRYYVTPSLLVYEPLEANISRNLCAKVYSAIRPAVAESELFKSMPKFVQLAGAVQRTDVLLDHSRAGAGES
jgi:hypothetical protein